MDNFFKRRKEKPRQEWNPHWTLKLLYGLWATATGIVKIALGAAATVLLICMVCLFVFVGILGNYLSGDVLPNAGYDPENTSLDQTSFVYYVDSRGDIQELQEIHTTADRKWASLEEIPQALIDATVAIEDKRFYEHQGVDWITTIKACANMFFGSGDFGGSTITQQLLKNLTRENSVTVQRKVMEIFRACLFEKTYDKDYIMEYYLNTIYLGRGCYGVKSAAEEYFGKELQMMTPAECASLISITNNPSMFNPYSDNEYEYQDYGMTDGARRNQIRQINTLWSMKEEGYLTQEEYELALDQAENSMVFKSGIDPEDKWTVCEKEGCGYEGIASTFNAEGGGKACPVCGTRINVTQSASQEVYSYFVDTVIEDVGADLAALDGIDWDTLDKEGKNNYKQRIQLGGYHIYSTLDMDVQKAVDAVYTDLSKIPTTSSNQQLQSAMVIINNQTGDIVAMAGGVGEKTVHDGLNRATDSKLQTGSSQKPLSVYAPAFEVGAISPVTVISDMPVSYTNGAYPRNDNRKYSFSRTVYSGIVSSVNAVSVNTLRKIGYDYSYMFSKEKFGLSTLTDHYETSSGKILNDLGDSPLGMGALTVGATVRDMAAAYATFANDGVYREARTYTKVYDSNGNLVLDNTQDSEQILSEKTVNYMNYCLQAAVNGGTGTAAKISGQNVAGKTGTTSSNRDRWFCGYTGYYTAAVWCGFDQPEVIKLTGNTKNPAARLFTAVLTPVHEGLEKVSLYSTKDMRSYSVCLDTGKYPNDACSQDLRYYLFGSDYYRVDSAYAYSGDGPSGSCDKHVLVDYCVSGNGVATEYCRQFAGVEDVKIESRALLKMSKKEVDSLKQAAKNGLWAGFTDDRYVYYTDGNWYGFDGKANQNTQAPYVVCTAHTKQTWDAYQKAEQERLEQEKQEEEAAQATEPGA